MGLSTYETWQEEQCGRLGIMTPAKTPAYGVRISRHKREFTMVLLHNNGGTSFPSEDRERMLVWLRLWLGTWLERTQEKS